MNAIDHMTASLLLKASKPATLRDELMSLRDGRALLIEAETIGEKSNQQGEVLRQAKKLGIRVRTTRVNGGVVVQLAEVEPA